MRAIAARPSCLALPALFLISSEFAPFLFPSLCFILISLSLPLALFLSWLAALSRSPFRSFDCSSFRLPLVFFLAGFPSHLLSHFAFRSSFILASFPPLLLPLCVALLSGALSFCLSCCLPFHLSLPFALSVGAVSRSQLSAALRVAALRKADGGENTRTHVGGDRERERVCVCVCVCAVGV